MTFNSFPLKPWKARAQISRVLVFVLLCGASLSAQLPSQDPGHKQDTEVAGVKFSVPKSFNLEESSDSRVAFMRHIKYDLALFVAVPEGPVDDKYLTDLSNVLVSQLFPKEKEFVWKLLAGAPDTKVSKFQSASGNTKGFNSKKLFQTDFIAVKVGDREILVGYITQLGQYNNDARYLFERQGVAGMSMPGWYAQAHILASITGEKYADINPGTYIQAMPVKKN